MTNRVIALYSLRDTNDRSELSPFMFEASDSRLETNGGDVQVVANIINIHPEIFYREHDNVQYNIVRCDDYNKYRVFGDWSASLIE